MNTDEFIFDRSKFEGAAALALELAGEPDSDDVLPSTFGASFSESLAPAGLARTDPAWEFALTVIGETFNPDIDIL